MIFLPSNAMLHDTDALALKWVSSRDGRAEEACGTGEGGLGGAVPRSPPIEHHRAFRQVLEHFGLGGTPALSWHGWVARQDLDPVPCNLQKSQTSTHKASEEKQEVAPWLPPPKRVEMGAFYRVLRPMANGHWPIERSAEFGYTPSMTIIPPIGRYRNGDTIRRSDGAGCTGSRDIFVA
jgi:hypothetical protein